MNIRFLTLGLLAAALLATQHVSATSEAPTINLEDAIKHNNIPAVTAFLGAGGDVNSLFCPRDTSNWKLLDGAASFGTIEMVALLCDHRANLEARTTHGNTALILAIQSRRPENAIYLIDRYVAHGIGVNQANMTGETAFLAAISHGLVEVAQKLLDTGADTHAVTRHGHNAFHSTCAFYYAIITEEHKLACIKWLLALAPDKRPSLILKSRSNQNAAEFAHLMRASKNIVDLLEQEILKEVDQLERARREEVEGAGVEEKKEEEAGHPHASPGARGGRKMRLRKCFCLA